MIQVVIWSMCEKRSRCNCFCRDGEAACTARTAVQGPSATGALSINGGLTTDLSLYLTDSGA